MEVAPDSPLVKYVNTNSALVGGHTELTNSLRYFDSVMLEEMTPTRTKRSQVKPKGPQLTFA